MRILLRQSQTGLYFKSLGRWTRNPREALAFTDTTRAHDYSRYHRLTDTCVSPYNDAEAGQTFVPTLPVPEIAGRFDQA